MDYAAAVGYLLSLGRELAAPTQASAAKFNLENIRALAERLGHPERTYPCAHIAGTNGKGSTAAMLESILRGAGFRTGLYTSPHLERINERIRVAGDPISDENFAQSFSRLHELIEELLAAGRLRAHPTYFECLTAMAFEHFARARVEFGVFEVGLGGRLDATNVVEPVVTLVTPIDFDHENFLGHSLAEIAAEKAGILKPGVPVITATQRPEAFAVIARRAAQLGCRMIEAERAYRVATESWEEGCARATVSEKETDWRIDVRLNLRGRFQLRNALTAIAAARVLRRLGCAIPDEAIERGIAAAQWPGRLELLQERPAVYLDGAHNPAAARELAAFWEERFGGRRIVLVFGAMRDKAVDEIAGLLFPRAAAVILTEPHSPRAISAAQLAQVAGHHARRHEVAADAEEAVERALELAGADDAVFVTGSLYLVGALRHSWFSRARQVRVG
jgi:dihydrofolate synthase/folylpolyglutamate synthase